MICKFCQSDQINFLVNTYDYEYFTSKKKYAYYQCDYCKIVSLKSPPWQKLNKIYPKNYYSYNYKKNQNNIGKKLIYKLKDYIDRRLFGSCLLKIKKNM